MDYTQLAPDYIRAIAPYQPGKPIAELERELGISGIVKLASNENPLGCSPKALVAMQEALKTVALYPDGNGFELKDALSTKFGVAHSQIVLGNGSNDMLELTARAFLTVGDRAVYSDHAFAVYPLATQAVGGIGISVPAKDYGHDLQAMLKAAVANKAKLVFVANPNNPTGTWLAPDDVRAFIALVPRDVVVVLDEAYNEYLEPAQRADSVAWLAAHPNLIVSRTFSKAHGLAALRVGYGVMDATVADLLNRVRQPFNVNALAQAAAIAALADDAYVEESRTLNREGLAQLYAGLDALGIPYVRSHGNFVLAQVGAAGRINVSLLKQGVIVRPVANYDMAEYLRVSIGTESENGKFLSALTQALTERIA